MAYIMAGNNGANGLLRPRHNPYDVFVHEILTCFS